MFTKYLKQHSITRFNESGMAALYPSATDRAAWDGLSADAKQQAETLIAQYASIPYPMRTATGFMALVRTGSRQADEGPYFLRRRKLCAAVLNCCLHPDAPLDDVIDGVWCICEESTWVISAHNINPIPGAPAAADYPLPRMDGYIDLFAAQTGMILALTLHLLGKRIQNEIPQLHQRMIQELDSRILRPFLNHDEYWWMGSIRKDLNNWTPWIVSNILVCFFLHANADPKELSKALERSCLYLDRWLDCIPADGGCDEGAGYWNMAGGALLDCLEILEAVTDGKMQFWNEEKIRNIMRFPLQAEIGGGWFMNFADCDARPFLSGERLQLAGEKLNEPALTALGVRTRGKLADQINDTPNFTRLLRLLFHPGVETAESAAEMADVWLPDLQVRKVCRGGMTLCCKGGHNGENHNHNDVGSFMLYVDGEPQIVDAGNMVYTAKTFSDQRYTLWHTRSAYHNLPLVGGQEQQPGREHKAKAVKWMPDGLRLYICKAYDSVGLKTLKREFQLSENTLTVHDTVNCTQSQPVTWVFMLRNKPVMEKGQVLSGAIRLLLPEGMTAEAEEIPITDPRMARNYPGSLWRLLVTAPAALKHSLVFTIEKA